jgi:hypothetical protein
MLAFIHDEVKAPENKIFMKKTYFVGFFYISFVKICVRQFYVMARSKLKLRVMNAIMIDFLPALRV